MKLLIFLAVALILTMPFIEVTPIGSHTITAYCSCPICCGSWADNRPNGIVYGAHGVELEQGVSVAAPLPNGTVIDELEVALKARP